MHGTALYERRRDQSDERVRGFLDGQAELQARLIEGLDADQVRRNQRLVWTWDSLSLGLLLGWAPFELKSVPTASGETDIAVRDGTLDPWPFDAPRLELRCEGRRLTGRFDDERAMQEALDRAPWETLEIRIGSAT
jgi:Protein of unknown function (DUF3891)